MTKIRSILSEANDADLVACIKAEPNGTTVELYRRHASDVRARALQILGDRGLADGVVQEVFLRLWQRPDAFDSTRGTLHAYLAVQGRSRAIEKRRSLSASHNRELRCAPMLTRRVADPGPEQVVVAHVVADHVHRAVAQLPEAERMAIETAYFRGCSYRDTATLLGRPEGTVKTRIRSGLGHLRARLDPESAIDL